MLYQLWHLKIQILPVICALILCELPGILRYFKKQYYVPVYFALFPLRELNRDLSIYLGEDIFGAGDDLTASALKKLRKRISHTAIFSMAIAVVLTPIFAGFLSAFFLPSDAFRGFCMLFIAFKLIGLVQAAIGFKTHAISNWTTMLLFWSIYVIYFGAFLSVFETAYDWASAFVSKGDWMGLWNAFRALVFVKLIVVGFIVALVAKIVIDTFTDRKLRDKIAKDRTTS